MVKTVSQYLSSSPKNTEAKIGENLERSSNFEQHERKYANTRGRSGRARGRKSLKNTSVVFLLYL